MLMKVAIPTLHRIIGCIDEKWYVKTKAKYEGGDDL